MLRSSTVAAWPQTNTAEHVSLPSVYSDSGSQLVGPVDSNTACGSQFGIDASQLASSGGVER